MSVINPNPENDSLRFTKNEDGSYTVDWNKDDPNWSWMNNLTSKEIQIIIQQAIQDYTADK
jgi:hypothetical protein